MTDEFHYAQKGRSALGLLCAAVVTTLTIVFFLSGSLFFQCISYGLLILVASAFYAIIKGEEWVIGVKGSNFYWSYPRWPKSCGTIDLTSVNRVVITVGGGWLEFSMNDGSSQKIRELGGAFELNEFLRVHFSTLNVDFIDNR